MKGLFLYGIKCQSFIWDKMRHYYEAKGIIFALYPKDITKKCQTINDLTEWIKSHYLKLNTEYDFIVGHSMGGIIALQLSSMKDLSFKKTILIETFLQPSSSFYQNLLMKDVDHKIENEVLTMLHDENEHYTESLKNELRHPNFNFTTYLNQIKNPIYCIYGDRGDNQHEKIKNELQLPPHILNQIQLNYVYNACHFPMLENPLNYIRY